MNKARLITPVVLIIFNRPVTSARVFEAIREVEPHQLFVIADGPRENNPRDIDLCNRTRSIIEGVDWECEVVTNFSDNNLGCKKRVSSGLDWVFDLVDQAIILEDDCLPHSSFFWYCQELLDLFENDARIMSISGDNFQPGVFQDGYSYYYSRYAHIWGWATWRRAWKMYDEHMKLWALANKRDLLRSILDDKIAFEYWKTNFSMTYDGSINSWAYAWLFTCWMQNALTIIPSVNLVTNIGFGEDATHTKKISDQANIETQKMTFPLNHPPYMIRNKLADQYAQINHFQRGGRLKMGLSSLFRKLIKF